MVWLLCRDTHALFLDQSGIFISLGFVQGHIVERVMFSPLHIPESLTCCFYPKPVQLLCESKKG